MSIQEKLKFISECYVKPKYEVEASKEPYYLGVADLAFLPVEQMQRGLIFVDKPKDIQSDLLDKLKKALSITLVHFYPLAGQLATEKFPNENAISVYLDCNKGPGAQLIHAAADVTVSDLLSAVYVNSIVRSFFDLGEKSVNLDGFTRPLVSIQVTELVDGIVIGFTMNHSVADGTSEWHFINSLSEIFKKIENDIAEINDSVSRKPVFKPFFPDGYGPILKLPLLEPRDLTDNKDLSPTRERKFLFSYASMSKLKAMANANCGVHNISSFQALSALVWRCITRARKLQPDAETTLALAMNARTRLNPPLSDDYFGNFMVRNQATRKVSELLINSFDSVAMLVHQIVASQDEKAALEFFEKLAKVLCQPSTVSTFRYPNFVMIAGSARFDIYKPEFGLGKAAATVLGHIGMEDGKVTASPGSEGGRSVELEISLKPENMNALEMDKEFIDFVTLA